MILIYKCGQPGEKYQFIIEVWKLKKKQTHNREMKLKKCCI